MTLNMVQLGSYVDLVMGQAPPGETCNKKAEGTVFIKAGEFQARSPAIREWTTQPLKFAKTKDTLVCVVGATAGKVNFATFDCAIGRSVAAVRPKPEKVDALFLFHFLQTTVQILRDRSQGAAQGVITREMLQSLKLVLPPLPEQRRIAAILDQADALRTKRREAVAHLDNLTQSIFIDMFGSPISSQSKWPLTTLSTACQKISDGTHHSPPIQEKGIPYITAKHLKSYGLDFFTDPWFISESDHKKIFSRCDPQLDDVLYIKDGATTGIAGLNKYNFEFSMLSSLALLRTKKDLLHPMFLCHWLNHPMVKTEILGAMAGAAIRRLTLAKIKAILIPLPPIELQHAFDKVITQIYKLRAHHSTSLSEHESLFASLQHQAFRGEL